MDAVKKQGPADNNNMGGLQNPNPPPLPLHRISSGITPGALRAFLINYLPVATNTALVSLHHCPRTLIQEIRADTPFQGCPLPLALEPAGDVLGRETISQVRFGLQQING